MGGNPWRPQRTCVLKRRLGDGYQVLLGGPRTRQPPNAPTSSLSQTPWAVLGCAVGCSLSLSLSEPVASLEDLAYVPTAYACPSQRSRCTKLSPRRTGFVPNAVLGTAPATAFLPTKAEQRANLGDTMRPSRALLTLLLASSISLCLSAPTCPGLPGHLTSAGASLHRGGCPQWPGPAPSQDRPPAPRKQPGWVAGTASQASSSASQLWGRTGAADSHMWR